MKKARYVEYKLPYIFSSSPGSGAQNISEDSSFFEVLLDNPIYIPKHAKNCYITVQNATVWWNIYNIVEGVNDTIRVRYAPDAFNTYYGNLTLSSGLYDIAHINAAISRKLEASDDIPNDLIQFIPDSATGRAILKINYALSYVDFTVAQNFAELLGFNEEKVPSSPPSGTTEPAHFHAPHIAKLNKIDHLLINSDLVGRGIRLNNDYNNTLAQILITAYPGKQIISTPFNPPEIPANELIGQKRNKLSFWLTDQNGDRVDTNGEIFTCRLVIHYTAPLADQK